MFCLGKFSKLWKPNRLPNLGTAGRSVGEDRGMPLGTGCLSYLDLRSENFGRVIKRF
jgi:hypothetical protein